jgi:hypothetical protein
MPSRDQGASGGLSIGAPQVATPVPKEKETRDAFVARMRGKYGPDMAAPGTVLGVMTSLDESIFRAKLNQCAETVVEGNDRQDEKWVADGMAWCVKNAREACAQLPGYADGVTESSRFLISRARQACAQAREFSSRHPEI